MTPATILHHVASTMIYHPLPKELRMINLLVDDGLIRPVQSGKLIGYALTKAGYERQMFHQQR